MKNLVLIGSLSILMVSCGSAMRTVAGTSDAKLIEYVSLEQGCPKENIKILNSVKNNVNATYQLEVCGKKVMYKQIGNTFMEASKANDLMNSMNK